MSAKALPRCSVAPGDLVGVVATSGPVDPDRLARGVAWLESIGLAVRIGSAALERSGHGLPYLAGDDALRARDLQSAWCDPDVRAVLVARGGTGAGRLLEHLDWARMRAAGPRLLVGCSDVTVLHLAVAGRLGIGALWGPVVAGRALAGAQPEPRSAAALRQAMTRPDLDLVLDTAAPDVVGPRRTASGPLVGGTLSLLCAALGTPDAPRADRLDGAILVLEDVGEPAYRVDRMLTQLRAAGVLGCVGGIACGEWTRCGEPALLRRVLADRLGDLGVPVLLAMPFGHGDVQLSMPLGSLAVLEARTGRLVVPAG